MLPFHKGLSLNISHLGCDLPEHPGVLIELDDNTPIKAAYWVEYDHFILIDTPGSESNFNAVQLCLTHDAAKRLKDALEVSLARPRHDAIKLSY